MSLGMAMEAFIIRSRARFDLWLLLGARGLIRNLSFSFSFRRCPRLPLFVLLLNHHHMSGVFLMLSSAVFSIPCNSANVFSMPTIQKFMIKGS
jgi:hypothetical protein